LYSKWLLERIAESYHHIYDRIVLYEYSIILDGYQVGRERCVKGIYSLIEYKADFDSALNSIGKGNWTGGMDDITNCGFKPFGRLQQVVIAQIYGVDNWELEQRGFYRIPQVRGYAYHLMADRLNGKPHHGTKTQFKAS